MTDVLSLLCSTSPRRIVRALPAVIAMFDEHGEDFRPEAARILDAYLPLLKDQSLHEQIESLYDQLARVDGSDTVHVNDLLARLRDLEEREAREYEQRFDAWRPLKQGSLEDALETARSLLRR